MSNEEKLKRYEIIDKLVSIGARPSDAIEFAWNKYMDVYDNETEYIEDNKTEGSDEEDKTEGSDEEDKTEGSDEEDDDKTEGSDWNDKKQFIKNLRNGIISKYAYLAVLYDVVPSERDIELYHKYANLFSHKVAFDLVLYDENRNKNYDLTDEQIEQLIEQFNIHGDWCVYHFEY